MFSLLKTRFIIEKLTSQTLTDCNRLVKKKENVLRCSDSSSLLQFPLLAPVTVGFKSQASEQVSLQNESEENLPDVSRPQGFSLQANPEHREQVNQPCFPSGLESPYREKKKQRRSC